MSEIAKQGGEAPYSNGTPAVEYNGRYALTNADLKELYPGRHSIRDLSEPELEILGLMRFTIVHPPKEQWQRYQDAAPVRTAVGTGVETKTLTDIPLNNIKAKARRRLAEMHDQKVTDYTTVQRYEDKLRVAFTARDDFFHPHYRTALDAVQAPDATYESIEAALTTFAETEMP